MHRAQALSGRPEWFLTGYLSADDTRPAAILGKPMAVQSFQSLSGAFESSFPGQMTSKAATKGCIQPRASDIIGSGLLTKEAVEDNAGFWAGIMSSISGVVVAAMAVGHGLSERAALTARILTRRFTPLPSSLAWASASACCWKADSGSRASKSYSVPGRPNLDFSEAIQGNSCSTKGSLDEAVMRKTPH